jgi:predicted nucleic acid-binding protein
VKLLFDTSILVAAMVEAHPRHASALQSLRRAKDRLDSGLVAAHSIAELYAILTALPVRPRLPPTVAHELVKHDVLDILGVVPLATEDYIAVIGRLSEAGVSGGVTYDALIL